MICLIQKFASSSSPVVEPASVEPLSLLLPGVVRVHRSEVGVDKGLRVEGEPLLVVARVLLLVVQPVR